MLVCCSDIKNSQSFSPTTLRQCHFRPSYLSAGPPVVAISRRRPTPQSNLPGFTATTLSYNKNDIEPLVDDASSTSDSESTIFIFVGLTSIASTAGVFWSEIAVFATGCGPMTMPDWLERGCYYIVLIVSSISVFTRIVLSSLDATGTMSGEVSGGGLESILLLVADGEKNRENDSAKLGKIRVLLRLADTLALLAVAAAVLVLGQQNLNGESMDGMSGIDFTKCRARQSFYQNQ